MKTLEKLSKDNSLAVLKKTEMFSFLGGVVDTTTDSTSIRDGNGGVCYYDTVDTYDECGNLISECTSVCCE